MDSKSNTSKDAPSIPENLHISIRMAPTKQHDPVTLSVTFTGGLESLFDDQRHHTIKLPIPPSFDPDAPPHMPTIGTLINWLVVKFLYDSPKKDLFYLDGTVRPGILVLINDADWELEGGEKCELKTGDEVIFVSTLHGG